MATQVIRTGGSVRIVVNPRSIVDTTIVDGFLIISYSDGTSENAGFISSGAPVLATIYNTSGDSMLPGVTVDGFTDMADGIDNRLTALGY